jgi:hypothetical protein
MMRDRRKAGQDQLVVVVPMAQTRKGKIFTCIGTRSCVENNRPGGKSSYSRGRFQLFLLGLLRSSSSLRA